jgi:hypothetical protein
MELVFGEALSQAQRAGRAPAFLISVCTDLAKSALREHAAAFRAGTFCAGLAVLASGLLLGWADSQGGEVQGSVLVLVVCCGLVGLIWRKGAASFAVLFALGIPLFNIRSGHASVGDLLFFVIALFAVAIGSGVRTLLSGPFGITVAIAMGLALGAIDMVVATPVIAIAGAFLGGIAFGRWRPKPLKVAALFGFFEPVGVIVMMAMGMHAARHHFVFIDARSILIAMVGAAIGARFSEISGIASPTPEAA